MKLETPLARRSSWPTTRARSLFHRQRRPTHPDDGVVTAFRDGQVTLRSLRREDGFTNAVEEHGYQGVRVGDLVIHSMDGFAGAIGVAESDGKASPVVHLYRAAPDVDARFYAYVLRDLAIRGFIESLARGIRERSTAFDAETFRSLVLPLPPPRTQRAIADFLDRETARIDTLIAKKRRVIKLLDERRLVEIDSAFRSDGRDATPTSPIHVCWPGAPAPKGWSVQPFWTLAQKISRRSSGGEQLLSVYLEHGVIPHSDDGIQVHAPSLDLSSYQVVRSGDLVMNNQQAWRGSVAVSFLDGIVSPAYHVYRLSGVLDPQFANLLFRSDLMVGQYEQVSRGVGTIQRQISPGDLRQVKVPVPPMAEQIKTVTQLTDSGERLRRLAEQVAEQVKLLQEHRQALITAAVTGELEVPGVAA